MKENKDSRVQRAMRLEEATVIVKEEYDKLPSQLEAFKKEMERQESLPYDERRYPHKPSRYDAERNATNRILTEIGVTERLAKEYLKIAKLKLNKS